MTDGVKTPFLSISNMFKINCRAFQRWFLTIIIIGTMVTACAGSADNDTADNNGLLCDDQNFSTKTDLQINGICEGIEKNCEHIPCGKREGDPPCKCADSYCSIPEGEIIGECRRVTNLSERGGIFFDGFNGFSINANRKLLAVLAGDLVKIWQTDSWKIVRSIRFFPELPAARLHSIAISSSGEFIAAAASKQVQISEGVYKQVDEVKVRRTLDLSEVSSIQTDMPYILSLDFSSDEKSLSVSGCDNPQSGDYQRPYPCNKGRIVTFEILSGKIEGELNDIEGAVHKVLAFTDKKAIAFCSKVGGAGGAAGIYDMTQGKITVTVPLNGECNAIALLNDRYFAVGSNGANGTALVKVVNTENNDVVAKTEVSYGPITSLEFSSDGEMLAAAFQFTQRIVLFSVKNLKEYSNSFTSSYYAPIIEMFFTSNDDQLVLGGATTDGGLELWSIDPPSMEAEISGKIKLTSFAFSSAGTLGVGGSESGQLFFFNNASAELTKAVDLRELLNLEGGPSYALSFSADDQLFAAFIKDTILIFNVNELYSPNIIKKITVGGLEPVEQMAFQNNDKTVVAILGSKAITFSLDTLLEIDSFDPIPAAHPRLSVDGQTLAVVSSESGEVSIYDLQTKSLKTTIDAFQTSEENCKQCAKRIGELLITSDSTKIILGNYYECFPEMSCRYLALADVNQGTWIDSLVIGPGTIDFSIAISTSLNAVGVSAGSGFSVYNLSDQIILLQSIITDPEVNMREASKIFYSSDGMYIVTCDSTGWARLWAVSD